MDRILQNWDIILTVLLCGFLLGIHLGGELAMFMLKKKLEIKGYDFSKLIGRGQ